MNYDFQAAEQRIAELGLIFARMKDKHQENGTWDWWIATQIDEIRLEMAEAKSKMAVGQDGHQANVNSNVLFPIIPAWKLQSKETVQNGSL